MRPIVLGAAAISATTASASTFDVSLGSCTDASKKTPFELSAGVKTSLPSNGDPFCSVELIGMSQDLVKDTAKCKIFPVHAKTPIDIDSFWDIYQGDTHLTSILCSADSMSKPSNVQKRRVSIPNMLSYFAKAKRAEDPKAKFARIAIDGHEDEKREAMPYPSGEDVPPPVTRLKQREAAPVVTEGARRRRDVDNEEKREAEPEPLEDKPTDSNEPTGKNKREAEPEETGGFNRKRNVDREEKREAEAYPFVGKPTDKGKRDGPAPTDKNGPKPQHANREEKRDDPAPTEKNGPKPPHAELEEKREAAPHIDHEEKRAAAPESVVSGFLVLWTVGAAAIASLAVML